MSKSSQQDIYEPVVRRRHIYLDPVECKAGASAKDDLLEPIKPM